MGIVVGTADGETDGNKVGLAVGRLGVAVGTVGLKVGPADGLRLGDDVGRLLAVITTSPFPGQTPC